MKEAELLTTPVKDLDPAALELHREAVVVDGHVDTVLHLGRGGRDFVAGGGGHVDLERARLGGVDAFFFAHYIQPQYKPDLALIRTMELLDITCQLALDDGIVLASGAGDIRKASAQGKLALFPTIEGGEAVHGRVEILRMLHRLGIGSITLTWNERNQLADGLDDAGTGGGLTVAGKAVVAEMFRLGMLVDVSHLSPAGFWDVMKVAEGPVIASHANATALCAHRRNLSDAQARELADTGGVIGVTFAPPFLSDNEPSLIHVLDHIEHLCTLLGPGHVGLGTDFDGIGSGPAGLSDVSFLPRVTAGLLGRGFEAGDVKMILGENLLRLMEAG